MCDAVGKEQLWKESVLIVLFQASLSARQYLANNDGLSLELSWQVFMQFFGVFSMILILYSSVEMLCWDNVHECVI